MESPSTKIAGTGAAAATVAAANKNNNVVAAMDRCEEVMVASAPIALTGANKAVRVIGCLLADLRTARSLGSD